ncbi:MAG: fibronectin type III domain-containing protein [Treponema sp.]|nr:fibronectin type III domain-containing protein [Treponema sp.]
MKKHRWFAVISAMVMALAAFGCKSDIETETKIEYVDKKADETAPASVTELTATPKDRRILLTWKDAADSDIYGYEVSYSGTKPINRVVLPALDTTSMIVPPKAGGTYINGLANGTEYIFTVKTVDTSGNKSEGVTVKGTPDASETLKIALTASVPQENGYTGNKSNTKVTVTANITTVSNVKKVVWKKDGSLIAKTLLADKNAAAATETEDNAVWTFDITAQDESANGTYTVAAIDEAGREEAEQITIDNFDFTPPAKVKVTNAVYSSENSSIAIEWTEPGDADYHHVDITFTTNDGTSDSEPSQAITVNKGTTNKTFTEIESTTEYYTYTFVTYDELGNKGAEYIYKVNVKSQKVHYSNCVVWDFVLKDGTILSKDETPESDTVAAVIVRAAADGKPALGVGIVHNQMAWCTKSATGFETKISALVGDETSGYMDGRDGWDKLKAACSDAESNPENYPAWNYCRNYGANTGLEGDLATGWYLPTVAELYTIYQNKTAVNESLSKAGGSTFGTYCCYWSCCQDPSDNMCARSLWFYDGTKSDMHPKKVTVLKVTGVELVTLSYF